MVARLIDTQNAMHVAVFYQELVLYLESKLLQLLTLLQLANDTGFWEQLREFKW